MKFSYAKEMESKLKVFREQSKTRKTLFLTLVTTYGAKKSNNYTGLIQNEVTMDALFSFWPTPFYIFFIKKPLPKVFYIPY